MRLLLDTHIALWAIADDGRLQSDARLLIADPANEVWVSVASLWEIAIKHALRRRGRTGMSVSAGQAQRYFEAAGYMLLDVTPAHVRAIEELPRHHADPFDRMLIAQAMTVPLRLMTHDADIARYSDTIIES